MLRVFPAMIAESVEAPPWPDRVDGAITAGYLALIFGLPILGYLLMYLDFRRYLRSLRRAMVVVAQAMHSLPYWAIQEQPGCLAAFDLRLPCTEQEVMAAYRERVKDLHPDRGGDLKEFLRLQKQFEQAMYIVRGQANKPAEAG